jgi:hypothetical protein
MQKDGLRASPDGDVGRGYATFAASVIKAQENSYD